MILWRVGTRILGLPVNSNKQTLKSKWKHMKTVHNTHEIGSVFDVGGEAAPPAQRNFAVW